MTEDPDSTDPERARQQTTVTGRLQEWMALESEVMTLSGAFLLFSLAMQMTTRYIPELLSALGAGAIIIGFFGTFKEVINSFFPYVGGKLSDRFGTRATLTTFGLMTGAGFLLWAIVPWIGTISVGGVEVPGWIWIYAGLILVLAWKELGIGATFALVKDAVPPDRLARGFASTEVFRRVGFLLGPLIAAGLLWWADSFLTGFQLVLFAAVGVSALATVLQFRGYRVAAEQLRETEKGQKRGGLRDIISDVQRMPEDLKPLLLGDSLVRFANGMVYSFFVLAVTQFHEVGLALGFTDLSPSSFFGVLLGIEMAVALGVMVPAARIGDRLGQKPVVAFGFLIYAVFPVLLIFAPSNGWVLMLLFAFSGLRFAGIPAHKAAIVGPSRSGKGGTTTGVYYLIRNTLRTPGPAIGGFLYEMSPQLAFSIASGIGMMGVLLYILFGHPIKGETIRDA